jgi:3-phenylpropionate/trans-cinnamate dioxygenase ferredoxin component
MGAEVEIFGVRQIEELSRRERFGKSGRQGREAGGPEMAQWIDACAKDDIEPEDVTRFDHAGQTYAIYRSPDDEFFATDGLCTHEQVHLAGGLVMDDIIECPKHNGRFNYKTGAAKGAPVCVNLRTYPVRVQGDRVQIEI